MLNRLLRCHNDSNYRAANIVVNRQANAALGHNAVVKKPSLDTAGSRIRALRRGKGLNQAQLAKRASIAQPSLSQIETGDTRTLRGPTLMNLAKALEVNPHWILTGRDSLVEPQSLTVEESELLTLFRTLQDVDQDRLVSFARTMVQSTTTPPSRLHPYPKAKSKAVKQQ
jgi:transcriptional regulator with XRE-family HTH domain